MRRVVRRLGASAGVASLAVATGVITSGCGSSPNLASESASQIIQAMTGALDSASSTTINGTLVIGSDTVTVAATIFSNGDIDGAIARNGSTTQLIQVGGNDYFNGSAGYFTNTGTATRLATQLAGKWIEMPDSQAPIGQTISFGSLVGQMTSSANGTLRRGGTRTIDGQRSVAVTSPSIGTIWVAATGTPYPVMLVLRTSNGTGSIMFSNWNEGTVPVPPTGSQPASTFSASGVSGTSGTTGSSGASGNSGATSTSTPSGGSGTTGTTGTKGTSSTSSTSSTSTTAGTASTTSLPATTST